MLKWGVEDQEIFFWEGHQKKGKQIELEHRFVEESKLNWKEHSVLVYYFVYYRVA